MTAASAITSVALTGNSSIGGSGDLTISPVVSGNFGLTKVGAGALTLAANNQYTGFTNVNEGTLLVNGTHSTGNTYTVASGATLGGTGSITLAIGDKTMTIDANGTLSPGASIESLDVTADLLDLNGTLFIEYDDTASPRIDVLNVAGILDITGATLSLDDVSLGNVGLDGTSSYILATYTTLLGTGAFDDDVLPLNYVINYAYLGNNIALVPVPEPGSMALAAMGIIGLGLSVRRRRK